MMRSQAPKKPLPSQQKGFSLLEVLLAVTIAITLGSMQLGQLKRDTEGKQAEIVGQQMRIVGNAFNAYLAQYYGVITTLQNVPSPGDPQKPGPLTCNTATRICTITSDTLRRSGLLPASFSGRNSYGSTYNYYIRVSGTAPYYRVDGIVTTNDPYTVGGVVRHDMIGVAMLSAGADSGSTRTVANQINGYNGTWLETSFPQVNQIGLLAYRAGYGASNNSTYLRTDGSNPMTGNLNMNNYDILNGRNIQATGQVRGGNFRTELANTAAIQLGTGADTAPDPNATLIGNQGNRLKIANTGGLELVNTTTGTYSDLYAGNITGTGNLTVSGFGNFQGDLNAQEIRSRGRMQAGTGITSNGSVSVNSGDLTLGTGNVILANGDLNAGRGTITSKELQVLDNATIGQNLNVGANLGVTGTVRIGTSLWRHDPATNTLTTTSGANFAANNITANGYMNLGTARGTSGQACSLPNGTIGLDNTSGQVIACSGGAWRGSALTNTYSITGPAGRTSTAVCAANERVTGCTAVYISRGTVDDPSNAAIAQVVNSTQCTVQAPGSANVTLQAVAVCAR